MVQNSGCWSLLGHQASWKPAIPQPVGRRFIRRAWGFCPLLVNQKSGPIPHADQEIRGLRTNSWEQSGRVNAFWVSRRPPIDHDGPSATFLEVHWDLLRFLLLRNHWAMQDFRHLGGNPKQLRHWQQDCVLKQAAIGMGFSSFLWF